MASEISRIEDWIYDTLKGDVGAGGLDALVNGRIWRYIAKQGTAYPLVVFSLDSGRDVQGLGTNRVMTRPLYLIKVISQGAPTDAARSAVDRIDELIGKAAAVTHNGYVFSGRRERSISYLETETNSQTNASTVYRHVGGLYRIEAYPA